MGQEQNNEQQQQEQQGELSEIEIAELANRKLREKEDEINRLKKELAKEKLLSTAVEEERPKRSKEELLKIVTSDNGSVCDYDKIEALCDIADIEKENGRQNPFGAQGDDVVNFLRSVIDECDGDKTIFHSIYQSKIGADDPQIAMAYNSRKRKY